MVVVVLLPQVTLPARAAPGHSLERRNCQPHNIAGCLLAPLAAALVGLHALPSLASTAHSLDAQAVEEVQVITHISPSQDAWHGVPWPCALSMHSRAPATLMSDLQAEAATAYADRDFSAATQKLNELVENDPNSSRWHEMRAQVLVDGKNFRAAVDDFDAALQEVPGNMLSGCPGHCRANCNACLCKHAAAAHETLARHLMLAWEAAQCPAVGSCSTCHHCCGSCVRCADCWPGLLSIACDCRPAWPSDQADATDTPDLNTCVWWAAGSECLFRVGLTTGCCRVVCTAALLSPGQPCPLKQLLGATSCRVRAPGPG